MLTKILKTAFVFLTAPFVAALLGFIYVYETTQEIWRD